MYRLMYLILILLSFRLIFDVFLAGVCSRTITVHKTHVCSIVACFAERDLCLAFNLASLIIIAAQ